jgi:hypothetical protein
MEPLEIDDKVFVTALVLAIGYFLQYCFTALLDWHRYKREQNMRRNKAELDRINYQIDKAYGPLRAVLLCSRGAFSEVVRRHSEVTNDESLTSEHVTEFLAKVVTHKNSRQKEAVVGHSSMASSLKQDEPFGPHFHSLSEVQQDWILWVTSILQPMNRRVVHIITDYASAFDGKIPSYFAEVLAHSQEYEVVIKKWEHGNFMHMMPALSFNNKINVFVETQYDRLVTRKGKLLNSMDDDHAREYSFLFDEEEEDGRHHIRFIQDQHQNVHSLRGVNKVSSASEKKSSSKKPKLVL